MLKQHKSISSALPQLEHRQFIHGGYVTMRKEQILALCGSLQGMKKFDYYQIR